MHRGTGRNRDRLILQRDDGAVQRISAQWTDLRDPDAYTQVLGERVCFRAPDLQALAELVCILRREDTP